MHARGITPHPESKREEITGRWETGKRCWEIGKREWGLVKPGVCWNYSTLHMWGQNSTWIFGGSVWYVKSVVHLVTLLTHPRNASTGVENVSLRNPTEITRDSHRRPTGFWGSTRYTQFTSLNGICAQNVRFAGGKPCMPIALHCS